MCRETGIVPYTVKLDIVTNARENREQLGSDMMEISAVEMILLSLKYPCLLAT